MRAKNHIIPDFLYLCICPTTVKQFAVSLGKENPYIFSKFNPLNTDTFYGPLSGRINGVWL